jgi:hypothetical protein
MHAVLVGKPLGKWVPGRQEAICDGIMMGEGWWGLWEFELDRFCSELCSVMGLDIGGFEVHT